MTDLQAEKDRIQALIARYWETREPFYEQINEALKDVQAAKVPKGGE
ncbi:hypothetical protein LCGC14_1788960 [marine sediment metagenome]|uniref:Uncharacterized protein n=1 Tax=marine sediment metagenome TaxID=412755 RepID=A0A0F9GT31_9ZZZZ